MLEIVSFFKKRDEPSNYSCQKRDETRKYSCQKRDRTLTNFNESAIIKIE